MCSRLFVGWRYTLFYFSLIYFYNYFSLIQTIKQPIFFSTEPTGNVGPKSFTGSGLVYPSEPGLSVPITINVESMIDLKKKRF